MRMEVLDNNWVSEGSKDVPRKYTTKTINGLIRAVKTKKLPNSWIQSLGVLREDFSLPANVSISPKTTSIPSTKKTYISSFAAIILQYALLAYLPSQFS